MMELNPHTTMPGKGLPREGVMWLVEQFVRLLIMAPSPG